MSAGVELEPSWTLMEYLWGLKVPPPLHISVTLRLILPVENSHSGSKGEKQPV